MHITLCIMLKPFRKSGSMSANARAVRAESVFFGVGLVIMMLEVMTDKHIDLRRPKSVNICVY